MSERICPTCHDPIPELALACPTCLGRQAQAIYLEHQKRFLPGVLKGVYSIALAKAAHEAKWHMRLIGDAYHAWCGETISPQWRHRHFKLGEPYDILCPRCAEVFEQMVRDIAPEVA